LVLLRIRQTNQEVTRTLQIDVLREIPEDAELRLQWNALVDRVERPQVFYTYEWALAVQSAYRATLRPLVVLAYDEQRSLCGVAALAAEDSEERASFLCATTGDYCDFLTAKEDRAEFVHAVLEALRKLGIRKLVLTNLPADSPTAAALRDATRQQGWHCFPRTAYICAQVSFARLELRKDGKRVAPGLKRLRRFEKAMGPQSTVHTEHVRSWEALAPSIPGFIQAHVSRFLEIGRISNLADERRQFFLYELARILPKEWLVLTRMWAGDKIVAWHYGFQFAGTWFWYQPTFDSSVEKHWPGFCVLSQVIQDAIDTPGMTTLDLGLGSEAYKAKFANESRETLHVTLSDSLATHWRTVGRYRLAEAVKASPRVEKIADSLRQRLQGIRRQVRERGSGPSLVWAGQRALDALWKSEKVIFFAYGRPKGSIRSRELQLRRLELSHLGFAAMEHSHDERTCSYLIRAARRMRTGGVDGYVLIDTDDRPVHIAWAAPFDGFLCEELNATLEAEPNDVILFDCWTPTTLRGHGHYRRAIELIGAEVEASGKRPWIFSASTNLTSVKGIEKAGYRARYALVRRRFLGSQSVRCEISGPETVLEAEVSARAS
jgi:CelD/BcsL family acetyltransferase involved in cellulose biosynthesis